MTRRSAAAVAEPDVLERVRRPATWAVKRQPSRYERMLDVALGTTMRLRELLTLERPTAEEASELVRLLFAFDMHHAIWMGCDDAALRGLLVVRGDHVKWYLHKIGARLRDRWLAHAQRDPVGFVAMLRDHVAGRSLFHAA